MANIPNEEIPTAQQSPKTELPQTEKLLVCTWCSAEELKHCLKCDRPFCFLHSSKFSPAFCQECFHRLNLIVDTFSRVVEDYNPTTDAVVRRKQECDRLRMDGPDWVWFTQWVNKLSDEDLKVVYEFHYFVLKLIENANEIRKTERSHRIQVKGGLSKAILTTEKTTEKRVRKTTKVIDLRSQFKKQFPFLSDTAVDAMVKAAEGA